MIVGCVCDFLVMSLFFPGQNCNSSCEDMADGDGSGYSSAKGSRVVSPKADGSHLQEQYAAWQASLAEKDAEIERLKGRVIELEKNGSNVSDAEIAELRAQLVQAGTIGSKESAAFVSSVRETDARQVRWIVNED
jgi:hypothetical protein